MNTNYITHETNHNSKTKTKSVLCTNKCIYVKTNNEEK